MILVWHMYTYVILQPCLLVWKLCLEFWREKNSMRFFYKLTDSQFTSHFKLQNKYEYLSRYTNSYDKELMQNKKIYLNVIRKKLVRKIKLFIFISKHHTKAKMFRVSIFFSLQFFFAWAHSEQCFSMQKQKKTKTWQWKEKQILTVFP